MKTEEKHEMTKARKHEIRTNNNPDILFRVSSVFHPWPLFYLFSCFRSFVLELMAECADATYNPDTLNGGN